MSQTIRTQIAAIVAQNCYLTDASITALSAAEYAAFRFRDDRSVPLASGLLYADGAHAVIDLRGTVRVFDEVADALTTCHDLSEERMAQLRAQAAAQPVYYSYPRESGGARMRRQAALAEVRS